MVEHKSWLGVYTPSYSIFHGNHHSDLHRSHVACVLIIIRRKHSPFQKGIVWWPIQDSGAESMFKLGWL